MATSKSNPNPNPNPNPMKRCREKFEARPALRDRFDAKVEEMKQRGPVGTPEITRLYGDFLLELTRNSKPLIMELTAIAAKYKGHVDGIANAILDRIVKVPVEQKLPSWYLLDSILKNVGDQYRLYFAGRLDKIFVDTYKKLSSSLRPAMVHLFRTWGKYIPSFARDSIEDFVQKNHTPASSGDLSHSGSHSPHLLHGHVNAKYLEAHHQMEHSAVDAQQTRLPPSLLSYGQKSSVRYGEYDHDDQELLPPHRGFQRVETSAIAGVNDVLSLPRRSPHPRVGPKLNSFSEAVADRPSLCGFESERPSNCNVELTRGWPDGEQNTEASLAYNRKNECGKLQARLLNDSYGSKVALHEKVTKFQKLNFNGISSDMPVKESQSSEEEFVWEKMSPTFPWKECNSTLFGHNTELPMSNVTYFGNDFGSNRHNQSADIIANPGCRASGDKFQDYVVSRKESMLQSQNFYHRQETLKLSNEAQERSVPLAATPVSPRLVPLNSCYVQAQGAVFSPNSSDLSTEIIPPNPPPQSSLHTSHPIYLPSLHPSPFSLPAPAPAPAPAPSPSASAAAAAASSLPLIATVPLTPHHPAPFAPLHPASHNFACPPLPICRFNPAYPLPILPPPVAAPYNSLSFTYLPSGQSPLPPSGPLPASSQTPPVPQGTNAGISESPASAFPGLLSSLLAQGFLSCPSNLSQDALIDFNAGLPKVRHESSINALYDNLSKQCKACGMRYMSQEDLIGHMDWHMTVDRVARNRNQKPSCNWYVSAKEWLSGVEALGDDLLPVKFSHMNQ